MKNLFSLLALSISIFLISCSGDIDESNCNSLYYNSFEDAQDFENLEGYWYGIADDSAPGGGDSCLVVCGGCIGPHLYFDIGPFGETKEVSVNFQAKSDFQSSLNVYTTTDVFERIEFIVKDSTWTYYESEKKLLLGPEDTLRLDFMSGGIIAVTSFFDQLSVCEE